MTTATVICYDTVSLRLAVSEELSDYTGINPLFLTSSAVIFVLIFCLSWLMPNVLSGPLTAMVSHFPSHPFVL